MKGATMECTLLMPTLNLQPSSNVFVKVDRHRPEGGSWHF
jgi:hypothetical protein